MLRRQKHVLSQSTTPFACTLLEKPTFTAEFLMCSRAGDGDYVQPILSEGEPELHTETDVAARIGALGPAQDLTWERLRYKPEGAKKHAKKFCIENFGAPKTPPLEILYVALFSCIVKGKEAPNIKNLQGSGVPEGGVWERGFLPKFFMLMPILVPDANQL